jgi:hypothetical protein
MSAKRIADDFEYIAQRLQEIENEKQPEPGYDDICPRCEDYGWLQSGAGRWKVCPNCRNRFDRVKPR